MQFPNQSTQQRQQQSKPFDSEEDYNKRLELMKINKERKKQGLEPIAYVIPSSNNIDSNNNKDKKDDPPKAGENPNVNETTITATNNSTTEKPYSYYQGQIQATFAQLQGERTNEIAKLSRKEKHIIYLFDEKNLTPPKAGVKPGSADTQQRMISMDVYYNTIPNSKHLEFEKKRAEIAKLQSVKAMQSSTIDENGQVKPPQLTKNDPTITNVDDATFKDINNKIQEETTNLYKEMALWMYGIDESLFKNVETNSFMAAIEAGQYREQFGLVSSSKNSTAYLT